MNSISLRPFSNRRRLGAAAVLLVGLAAPLSAGDSLKPAPSAKTQPMYLAYTVNNVGYLYTCG